MKLSTNALSCTWSQDIVMMKASEAKALKLSNTKNAQIRYTESAIIRRNGYTCTSKVSGRLDLVSITARQTSHDFFSNSKLPAWVQSLIPNLFYIEEKSWNYFPYTTTGLFATNFLIVEKILVDFGEFRR